ncbi:hypothetical protein CDO28_20155 (plasmid) [Sinorhizobium meliloti]|uniref:AfsR/SARP family transcriptional regulator n=1 Tax=Rhizobium meliloti TaxID=382 RepID=UPI000B4A2967|nr:BTAD domain-containing putative transcriptional regulator [Sinorhizobium meliloti]ASP73863.1 hypothetical protein CDO28_20155 [Sinorhizobium meliloti]MDE3858116.1 hypothetical protein [Sinorhizobium meliloti]MQW53401.1 hypothetical protein [Sinorhizobium meliloti]
MLEISLLGSFSLKINGIRIYPDLGPAGQRMAAYLFASPGKLHRRERLADLFWREMPLERSRAALNSAMWRLRKILCQDPSSNGASNLRSAGEYVVFELAPWIQVDAEIISNVAKRSYVAEEQQATTALQKVIDLYDGPFMEGEGDAVFVEERERLHSCFVELAHEVLALYIAHKDYPNAIAICRRVLSFDPYREYFVRKILGLLCLNEQRAEAASFYERWQKTLRDDIGVGPMPETLNLLRVVRRCETFEDVEKIRTIVHMPRQSSPGLIAW